MPQLSRGVEINYENALTHINMLYERLLNYPHLSCQILDRSTVLLDKLNKIVDKIKLGE